MLFPYAILYSPQFLIVIARRKDIHIEEAKDKRDIICGSFFNCKSNRTSK